MIFLQPLAALAAFVSLLGTGAGNATTFHFKFDDGQFPPFSTIVGTGTLSVDERLAAGTFAFSDLTNIKITFSFPGLSADGVVWTEEDIAVELDFDDDDIVLDPLELTFIDIREDGGFLLATFSSNGSRRTCAGGALDLLNGPWCLSMLDQEYGIDFDNTEDFFVPRFYVGMAPVPLPATAGLLLTALAAIRWGARRSAPLESERGRAKGRSVQGMRQRGDQTRRPQAPSNLA